MDQIKGVSHREARKEAEQLMEVFKLSAYANVLVGDLLLLLKSRLFVATAFLSPNRIILLDEPTEGLDVINRNKLWKSILVNFLKTKCIALTSCRPLQQLEGPMHRLIY